MTICLSEILPTYFKTDSLALKGAYTLYTKITQILSLQWTGLEMSASEGNLRLSVLETKFERQRYDNLGICRGGIVDKLGK